MMLDSTLTRISLCLGFLSGCEGQQYVDPATLGLVVTDDATDRQRVNRCHYVPVLLGSQVKFRYEVDGDLSATLTLTRTRLSVDFEPAGEARPLRASLDLDDDEVLTIVRDADWEPPPGYRVDFVTGCTPSNEYTP